jgi:Ca2+-binding EF-hand superfamily protein
MSYQIAERVFEALEAEGIAPRSIAMTIGNFLRKKEGEELIKALRLFGETQESLTSWKQGNRPS